MSMIGTKAPDWSGVAYLKGEQKRGEPEAPRGVVRAYHVNDLQVGRSPAELLRTVRALQSGGYCGADWKKGDAFVR